MKKIIISAFALITGVQSFAQEASCPTINVSTSGYEFKEGELISVTANVSGNESVTYNWSISAGTITSGQGTSSITIDSKGLAGQNITASLDVGGLLRTCSSMSSATVSITEAPKPAPAKGKVKAKVKVKKPASAKRV